MQVAREAGGSGCCRCCCRCRCRCCCCCGFLLMMMMIVVMLLWLLMLAGQNHSDGRHDITPKNVCMRKASRKTELFSYSYAYIYISHIYIYIHLLLKYHISPIFTVCFTQICAPPKTNSSPLKNDAWKTSLSF